MKIFVAAFLIAVMLGSCSSFRPRKVVKLGILGLGGGMVAGSVMYSDGDYTQIMNNDTSRLLATMGGTFIVFGIVGVLLDVTINSKDITGGL